MKDRNIASRPVIDWGVAARRGAAEAESETLHLVQPFPKGVQLAVVQGIGSGPKAAAAAKIAVATLEEYAGEPVVWLVRLCHERLKGTGGVLMTLASLDAREDMMTWLSVGRIEGLLLRADPGPGRALAYAVMRGGVVGEQLPPLHTTALPISRGDVLVLAVDGISYPSCEGLSVKDPPQEIADCVLATQGNSLGNVLVLVARYVGLGPGERREGVSRVHDSGERGVAAGRGSGSRGSS